MDKKYITAHYIDIYYIYDLVKNEPNDQELGQKIRAYIQLKDGSFKRDEPFFSGSTIMTIAPTPSTLKNKTKKN